jgi:hypothetical protein
MTQIPAQVPPTKIDNWLWQSIVVTVCCCVPLGIVGIVFAAQVNSKLAAGDIAGAQESANKAKKFTLIGIGVGLVVYIIVAIVETLAIVAATHH